MNKEEAKKQYGSNLKRLRLACGMSQDELAKALGYTNRSSINKIEVGRSNIPADKIARTAEVLGVSPLELFGEKVVFKEEVHPERNLKSDKDKLKTMIFNGDISKLNEPNQARLMSYYQALLDTQEETDEST